MVRLLLLAGLTTCAGLARAQRPSADALNAGVGTYVGPTAVQADGRILIGGKFTTVRNEPHARLARLSPDGVVESGFTASANDTVYALAVQPDGKILVGGDFTTLCGQHCAAIGRLTAGGVLDRGFSTHVFEVPLYNTLTAGAQAIVVQPDGKIVVGAELSYNGRPFSPDVRRLNTDGTLDTTFTNAGLGFGPVTCLALQSDGKILVGGLRSGIARLNRDGTWDTNFSAALGSSGADRVYAIAVQADGAILLGGELYMVGSQWRTNLARLHPTGSLDLDFNPGTSGFHSTVYSLAMQADGKILVGGLFTALGGESHARIGRLNPDGTPDDAFTAGASLDVYGVAVQPDGKVLVGGYFGELAGQPRGFIGRLNNLDPGAQSLSCEGTTVTWRRSGSSCEVWRTTFESSTDGTNWVSLGEGTRIDGGWELVNTAVPPGARVRARGYTAGAAYNSSSWFIESVWPPGTPTIITTNNLFGVRSNRFGFNIGGSSGSTVVVEGSTNLSGWTPLATNVLSGSPPYFSDPDCLIPQQRFYRVRSL